MKKTVTALTLILTLGAVAGAQTMEDAINISRNNYSGTAKTIALANAVTALGGDLGTIGINPAGSAIAGYSQMTITPSLSISTANSSYAPSYLTDWNNPSESGSQTFGVSNSERRVRAFLPNMGVSLRFTTGKNYGLKSYTMGFVSNQTNQFNYRASASGYNTLSTISGCLAAYATEDNLPSNILSRSGRYSSGYNWNQIVAYHGGLINFNKDAGTYFGSAEHVDFDGTDYSYGLKGTLLQTSKVQKAGAKNDVVINLGLNFNDNFFLGFNLGVPSMKYRYAENFYEDAASDASDFVVSPEYYGSDGNYVKESPTAFRSAAYEYSYTASIDGVYLGVGAIWLPLSNLRVGASFRTPTTYTIRETYQSFVTTDFAYGSESAYTELGEYAYCLRSPYTFDLGVAYTFGPLGLLSIDYELTDYSIMEYRSLYDDSYTVDNTMFSKVNEINSLFCGRTHSLRVGAEVKILPQIALRAGYSFLTDPRRNCTDSKGNTVDATWYDNYYKQYKGGSVRLNNDWSYCSDKVRTFSLGFGFISGGPFFADLSARLTKYPETDFSPYGCYIDNDDVTVDAPVMRTRSSIFDMALTLGLRF